MALLKYVKFIAKVNTQHNLLQRIYGTWMSIGWTTKGVVPDVVHKTPPTKLAVQYAKITINEGNTVRPKYVKDTPDVGWKPLEDNLFYVVCMCDPDAPSRKEPSQREWLHWLVVNIPGRSIEKGEVLSEYVGAGPPKGTGLHRYVFLLYQQPGKINFTEKKLTNKSGKGRGKFSVKKFAEKYKLGLPIGGNFFEAEWDDYVPELHKQLGIK